MFIQKLRASWLNSNSLLCVRLDPDLTKLLADISPSLQTRFWRRDRLKSILSPILLSLIEEK